MMFDDDLRNLGADLFEDDRKYIEDDYSEFERMLDFHEIQAYEFHNASRNDKQQYWDSYEMFGKGQNQ